MKSLKIAYRTLLRSKRRSALTITLIAVGVAFVLLFGAFSGSFKSYMVSQITDSMLGHVQIHHLGYVESLDNMPLDKNLKEEQLQVIEKIITESKSIENYSYRLKLSALLSNYENSTNVRLNGIEPESEHRTLPLLKSRILSGTSEIKEGEVVIPEVVSKGMNLKVGDPIVLVATNQAGSMNAINFKVAGVLGIISGPGGRDGYIHINDARKLLRIKGREVNEIVLRLKRLSELHATAKSIKGNPVIAQDKLEVHTWEKLSPFTSISDMLDVMSISVQFILVSIVLISILNVMIMSIYERIKEIGTLSAIGTPSSFIASTFIFEGIILGFVGTIVGVTISSLVVFGIGDINFAFGRQEAIVLSPVLMGESVVLVTLLVVVISALASLYPALKAARMNPVEALRS